MAGAIPSEPGAAELLGNARADALSQLKQEMPGFTPVSPGTPSAPADPNAAVKMPDAESGAGPSPEAVDQSEGGSLDLHGFANSTEAPAPSEKAVSQTEDNGDPWAFSTMRHFLRDAFKGTGTELVNVVPRWEAKLGGWLTTAGAGLASLVDKPLNEVHKIVADSKDIYDSMVQGKPVDPKDNDTQPYHFADSVFNFKKNYIDPAVEHWTPQRATAVGQGEGSGPAAAAIGGGLEVAPNMLMGPAGLGQLVSASGTESTMGEIDQGHSLGTAVANGTVDALANYMQAKLGVVPSLPILKRVMTSISLGDLMHMSAQELKKQVLLAGGYKDDAAKIDPTSGLGEATVMNAVFGTMGGGHKEGEQPKAPTPAAVETEQAAPPPPVQPKPVPVAAGPGKVPDMPTAEPAKDLRAQINDMKNDETPRTGVFMSTDNLTALAGAKGVDAVSVRSQMTKASKENRAVNVPNGVIIMKTPELAQQVKVRFANNEDPQKVIGELTGAGTGKTPEQTAVVQGKTPEGAVAVEKGVTPAEVPTAVADVAAQGHTPVVTTPAEAVARRAEEVAKEGQVPVDESAAEPTHEEPALPVPVPRMGMFKPEKGTEVPVHIEDGAPEGKVRVRPIDKEGMPAERTIDVPADRVKATEAATTEAAPTESSGGKAEVAEPETRTEPEAAAAPSRRVVKTAFDSLPEALATHEEQEQPVEGRKNAAPLAERQDNAASFAAVLKAAAKEKEGKVDETLVKRAFDAAKAAEGLALKSKEATDKGQGTGHTRVTALVAEMHKAARSLMGEAQAGDEVVVRPKEAELKAKIEKKAAKENRVTRAKEIGEYDVKMADGSTRRIERVTGAGGKRISGSWYEGDRYLGDTKEQAVAELDAEAKTLPAEAKPAKKAIIAKAEPKVEVAVNEKYRDQLKPKLQQAEIQRKAMILKNEYIHADEKDAAAKRQEIHDWMTEHLEGTTPDQLNEVMNFLDSQRRENAPEGKKGLRMSDTLEEEEHQFDDSELRNPEGSMSKVYRPSFSNNKAEALQQVAHDKRMSDEWKALGDNLADEGFFQYLTQKRNTGEQIGAHFLMDRLIKSTDSPVLRDTLTTIRRNLPDLPVYIRDQIVSPHSGEKMPHAAGLFHGPTYSVHIQVEPTLRPHRVAQTIAHEFVHAATLFELDTNPTGQLARALNAAHEILVTRMRSKYGDETVDSHINYFNNPTEAGKPSTYERQLYGLANPHEMVSEILSNPDFQREVADSELFASPSEVLPETRDTLMKRIFRAIGNFLGVSDPKLLSHIASLTQSIMEAQSKKFGVLMAGRNEDFHARLDNEMKVRFGANPQEIVMAEHGLASLREEPPPLRGVDREMLNLTDDNTTETARAFVHSAKNRVTESVRRVVTELKTVAQIYRDHMSDFGGESDPSNPLRQLQEADISKNVIIKKMSDISRPVAEKWLKLSEQENRKLGQLLIDTTMYKIDPRLEPGEQPLLAQAAKGFEARHGEYRTRFNKLSKTAQEVYGESVDASKRQMRMLRKAGVDTAIHTFEADLSDAQKSLLYGAKTPEVYDSLIGPGKIIDIGEKNDALKNAVKDFAGMTEVEGPYAHLGRQGEYVVSAEPEGTRSFDNQREAEAFARTVDSMNPGSRANVAELGGKHVVDYKVQYVSMHETRDQAEAEAKRMTEAGFDVGHVTQKTMGKEAAPLAHGMQELVAEAERKINRGGKDEGTEALVASLRSAFLQMTAARSAYAGSRLARKNFAGVKPEDMRRNFAEHSVSTMWHAAQMRTVFERAAALARLRAMARDSQDTNASQHVMYRRGETVKALNMHARDEVQNFGHKAPFNSMLAKLGFMSYLASPAHAFLWMTQNFTTGIPVGGARWGYGKSAASFTKAMKLVAGPSFRSFIRAAITKGGNSSDIHDAIIKAVRADKGLGRWAHGENSAMQQLMDRGVINHGYSNELGAIARGDSARVARVFEWARLMPSMADQFNRVSTALAALEMTGGDIRKAADFVDEIHANYAQPNKPLLFKRLARVPGMNSITMFKTYIQAMAHLVYGNIFDAVRGVNRAQAIKSVAGTMLGTALFAGVYGGVALEPLKLAMYAWHKLADDEGESWDFRAAVHHFLVDHFGKKGGDLLANGPVPGALGFDLSSRMGLSDLFFHEPPDLLTTDKDMWANFVMNEAGPMPQLLANNVSGFMTHWKRGEPYQAVSAIIPVKAYQDAITAYDFATKGLTSPMGSQLTAPSGLDAVYKAVGFKPADVALAQQRRSENIEQRVAMSDARKSIVKDWAQAVGNGKSTATVMARVRTFNRNFPQRPITANDVRDQLLFDMKNR